ncbi:hypothetical protein Gotri_007788 [Gossypium trilobum]|uniref:Aminotransferase-like plant mobile domain-containing protein n=1 Tax=Gossypium trilobum TaxID=34281 RepID=A0A7J9EIU0_9ROSI|nr:hypothetical protein [Gossypium trilobum]
MIGGYLMPELSRNLVHLRWLLKLVDFRAARKFSWGSAVLATFYKEMCGRRHQLKPKSEVAYHYYNHGSHWSTMLPWRCTRWIECCGHLAFDN